MEQDNTPNHSVSNILIVDDIPANLTLLGAILKKEGYKIRPVPNGRLALQAAEKEHPDLILLDVMMPDMNGYEVCNHLRQDPELKHIPVIFISALSDTNDIVNALAAGGVDYITKPFQAEEVRARVATHLKLQQQRKELRLLNATKDKFFSIVAHDLRNPFSVLLSISDLLLNNYDTFDDDTRLELLTMQSDTTKQAFSLLQNLLEWSKTQRGTLAFNPVRTNLNGIITECVNLNKGASIHKEIQLVQLQADDFWVSADINMLQTIIRNLIGNAIKFTYPGGKIEISTKDQGAFVEISVSDNGTGISPENLSRLFKVEGDVKTQGTSREAGSGLGLILCKEFVVMHGGEIRVESEVGKGSVFRFTIPKCMKQACPEL